MNRTIAALLILTQPVQAQLRLDDLQPGNRVLVTAPSVVGRRYDAFITSRQGDTLVLTRKGILPVAVPLSAVTEAQLFLGRSVVLGAVRGAKRGAIVGAAVGLLYFTGLAEYYCEKPGCEPSQWEEFLSSAATGMACGALIGGIVRSDKWLRLQLSSPRSSASRAPVRIGVSIATR